MSKGISEIQLMVDFKPQLGEPDVKRTVVHYLEIMKAQGKLIYFRLNAGSFILTNPDGSNRRRVQGSKKGTADLIVIQPANVQTYFKGQAKGKPRPIAIVTFLEFKGSKGKQSPNQLEFERVITEMHCHYFVVRDVEEVREILEKGTYIYSNL